MSFGPADFAGFGGLDLRDPEDAQGAIALSNVRFDVRPGRLDPRPGYTVIGSLDHYYPNAFHYSEAVARFSVAGSSTNGAGSFIQVQNASGSSSAVSTSYGDATVPWSIVDAMGGSGLAPAVYYANGTDVLVRYRSAALTTLSAACSTKTSAESSFSAYSRSGPKPRALCLQLPDRRLVAAGTYATTGGPNGAGSNESTVWFSQPGDAEKWDETDYVDLGDDGDDITAAVTYGNNVFVFKKTKMFVFYGNSVDGTGGTVFNYRSIDKAFPGNDSEINQGNIVVAPEGVYVWTRQGVYVTTGSQPRLVSDAIQPMFSTALTGYSHDTSASRSLLSGNGTGCGFYSRGTLYWSAVGTGYDWYTLSNGQWSKWSIDGGGIGMATNGNALYTGLRTGFGLLSQDTTTDNGTAIASYYTSPYLMYGEPKAEKHVRASELHGTGTVTLAWGKDLQTHGTAETVAMSSGIGHARTGARGRVLSFKIAASAAGWTVNRVVPLLQAVRTGK